MNSAFRHPPRKQMMPVIAVEDDDEDDRKDALASLGLVDAPLVPKRQSHHHLSMVVPSPPPKFRDKLLLEKHTFTVTPSGDHQIEIPSFQTLHQHGNEAHTNLMRTMTLQESKVSDYFPRSSIPPVLRPSPSMDKLNRTEHRWVGTGIVANRRDLEMVR